MAQEVSVNNSTSVGVTISGAVQAATQAQVDAGIIANKYVSPKTLNDWSGGSSAWGSITGTLSAQTDLQAALDAKWSVTGTSTLTGATTIDLNGNTLTFQGQKVSFTTSATYAGLNIGGYAGTPSSLSDGDLWYHTTFNVPLIRINGANNYLLNNAGGLTANRVLYATGANLGSVGNSANLTFDGTTLLVGGGTATASTRLDVRGTGTSTNKAFRVADSGDTERFYIQDNGAQSSNTTVTNSNVYNYQYNGSTIFGFFVGAAGQGADFRLGSRANSGPYLSSQTNGARSSSNNGAGLYYYGYMHPSSPAQNLVGHSFTGSTITSTGTEVFELVRLASSITSASGSADLIQLYMVPSYNYAGGGNVYGIKYEPVVTAIGGTHYALYLASGNVNMSGLPISSAGLSSGDLWNNSGVINIV